jgi:UDP-N-acetylmuramoylalanine--D-glutamate ligase
MTDLAGKRVTVMGLGRFGGGIGVTRWLCAQGADVLVTDKDSAEDLAGSVSQIQPLIDSGPVKLRLGEHNVSDFTTCDLVVANAAVPKPWENRYLRSSEAAGVPITTEITLTLEQLRARGITQTVGITGSAGKSTTTAMIHHGLSEALKSIGTRVLMGGNIGGSLLGELDGADSTTIVILELSSAMLYWLDRTLNPKLSPHIAVITNISANHLDWHGDFAHYSESKRHLIEHQKTCDTAILGENVWVWREATKAASKPIDSGTFVGALALPGDHNRTNAAAAFAACRAIAPNTDPRALQAAIAAFSGLSHRLQLVAEKPTPSGHPLRFYNDSKSTTPESALRAVEAVAALPGMSLSRIHLIAGGYDKGSDLSPIARLHGELAGLYTIGATGPAISKSAGGDVVECATVERAVGAAMGKMSPGDALLLSPGCASWDQYVNFEERGDEFVRLVRQAVAR